MDTFAAIIDLWPTAADLASDIREKPGTVRQWKARNFIPAEHWAAIVAAGARRGLNISIDRLAHLAALRSSPFRSGAANDERPGSPPEEESQEALRPTGT